MQDSFRAFCFRILSWIEFALSCSLFPVPCSLGEKNGTFT